MQWRKPSLAGLGKETEKKTQRNEEEQIQQKVLNLTVRAQRAGVVNSKVKGRQRVKRTAEKTTDMEDRHAL